MTPTRRWAVVAVIVAAGCASSVSQGPAPGMSQGGGGSGGATAPDAAGGGTPPPSIADAAPAVTPPADADTGTPEAGPPATPGLTKIFDGTSWDNWVYDPAAWKIVDRAMVGKVGGGQSQAFTKMDYASFRLIVWSRMVVGKDHLGVCFWGNRPAAGKFGFGGCLLVIPPNGAIWDYLTNTDNPKPNYQVGMADWHKTEILANKATGRVQVAVNGKLVHDYQDPAAKLPRRHAGPIGMQIHKAGTESEYRDIEIEVDPKDDRLITLTP